MAPSALEARRKRIAREQNDILAMQQRIVEARRARDAAAHAFEEARALFEEATEELSALCSRCDAARGDLDELRQSYRRDFMATLPLDVLRCIFDEVAGLPPDPTEYSMHAALAPFVLAAVCSRWRIQALRHPSLWTCISAPGDADEARAALHRRRIKCLLQRSGSCPLDVVFRWDDCTETRSWAECPSYEAILKLVSSHARRWRTFVLSLPEDVGDIKHVAALKGPLPCLETFRFFSSDESEFKLDLFFPFSPKLRNLTIGRPNALYPVLTPPGLSSLRSLRLWYQRSLTQLIPLLSVVAPTLESLAFGLDNDRYDQAMDVIEAPLVLPKLKTFTFDVPQCASRVFQQLEWVQLPNLEHLLLSGDTICDHLTPFLEHGAARTVVLTLGGEIQPYHLEVLQHLPRLFGLCFRDFTHDGEPESEYNVADNFFTELSPDIWPSLLLVELGKSGVFTLGDGSGVLSFLRSRTLEAAGADSTPGRLEEFKIRGTAPGWIRAEVKRLLGI